MLDQSTNHTHSIGLFEQMPGAATQGYLGSFDYEQNMDLDPSFFAIDDDMAAFGSMLDDFVPGMSTEDNLAGLQ